MKTKLYDVEKARIMTLWKLEYSIYDFEIEKALVKVQIVP